MGPGLRRKQCEPKGLGIETSTFLRFDYELEWRNWKTHQAQNLALPRGRVSSTLSSSTARRIGVALDWKPNRS